MQKCGACAKFMARGVGISCQKCGADYHRACVGMAAAASAPQDWQCPTCKSSQPRDNKAETPVKGLHQQPAVEPPVGAASAAGSTSATSQRGGARVPEAPRTGETKPRTEDTQSSLTREMRLFREEIQVVRQELKDFRQEVLDIRASLSEFNKRIDSLDGRVDAIEQQVSSSTVSAAHKVLEDAVAALQLELNDRDQELLGNDVQVSGVPEEPGERAAFYVNERLTAINRQLFQRARETAHAAAWRYVWTRDGKIFARQRDRQPCHRIRRLVDLDIFGSEGANRVFS